ncbi:MAG: GTPase, partial [Halanaerobiaceae bacterium]
MQSTPRANRPHIAVFGRRNAGKSSLINALTNQELALVSEVAGTTADPVYKSMELLPLGPVVMIDTAGIDDEGTLGELRVKKTMEVIRKTDLALLVIDPVPGVGQYEKALLDRLRKKDTDFLIVINKIELCQEDSSIKNNDKSSGGNEADNDGISLQKKISCLYEEGDEVICNLLDDIEKLLFSNKSDKEDFKDKIVAVSAREKDGIDYLRTKIAENVPADFEEAFIIGDLIEPGDTVILVTPIDLAAPKGRLILPQVQTIRDVLDHDGMAYVTKERELKQVLNNLKEKPRIVVTDSQAFMRVDTDVPEDILMTGFSI